MGDRMTVRETNLAILELYKKTDRFIRDAYSSAEGVSEYIRTMEAKESYGRSRVNGWADDYRMLKHVRWVRNRLTHEVGYDTAICDAKDYPWLEAFYGRLRDSSDPLSLARKLEHEDALRRAEARKKLEQAREEKARANKKRKSFWQRLKELFF